jgi:hypothetical protein
MRAQDGLRGVHVWARPYSRNELDRGGNLRKDIEIGQYIDCQLSHFCTKGGLSKK